MPPDPPRSDGGTYGADALTGAMLLFSQSAPPDNLYLPTPVHSKLTRSYH